MDQDKMSNRKNRGLSIDASYQVLVHLAEGFRREESKLEAQVSLYRSPDINKSS
jgi:hypothetical protein